MTNYPSLHDEMRSVADNLTDRDWIQNTMHHGEAVCTHGAVMTCKGLRPGDQYIIRAVMRHKGLTESWNDADGRTKDEVLARMRSIEVSDADLAATFGPSWQLVIALIRRAAILTADEVTRMDATWAAARDAAWDAARAATWDATSTATWAATWDATSTATWAAARTATWDVARAATWAATWDAARAATWDAARAVTVADLVGQHGLTQAHIDTLMKPWTDALGTDWAQAVPA